MYNMQNHESPLVQFWKRAGTCDQSSKGRVQLRELALSGFVNLRGNPADAHFLQAVQSALGTPLPLSANSTTSVENHVVLWLGPDEWLISSPPGEEHRIIASLRDHLACPCCSVTDVTSGYTTIALSGSEAENTLAKGCSVDLDIRTFPVGGCLQTQVAKANIAIWRPDTSLFLLIVRRSFAEYLALWIEDAAQEFGLAAVRGAEVSSKPQEVAVAMET